MGNTVKVVKAGTVEVFEDVVGHQIGNGAIQILERNGNQRVINNFEDVTITLDETAAKNFAFEVAAMEAKGEVEVSVEEEEALLAATEMEVEDVEDEDGGVSDGSGEDDTPPVH